MSGKGGGAGDMVRKEEDKLQALVLADSFTGTFRPSTLETPKVSAGDDSVTSESVH
jgi:hypothetical protein